MCASIPDSHLQVGMGAAEVVIPITMLLVKELNVKGSFRYGVSPPLFLHRFTHPNTRASLQPGDYELAISLAAQGKIDLKPLVTHR